MMTSNTPTDSDGKKNHVQITPFSKDGALEKQKFYSTQMEDGCWVYCECEHWTCYCVCAKCSCNSCSAECMVSCPCTVDFPGVPGDSAGNMYADRVSGSIDLHAMSRDVSHEESNASGDSVTEEGYDFSDVAELYNNDSEFYYE